MRMSRPLLAAGRQRWWLLSLAALALLRFRPSDGAHDVFPEIYGERNAIHVNYAGSKLDGPRRARHIPGITSYSPYGHYDDVSASRPNPFLEEEEGQRTSDLLGYVGEVPLNLTDLFDELKVVLMSLPIGVVFRMGGGGM